MNQVDMAGLARKAREVWSPSAPIDRRDLFAGRLDQLARIQEAVATKGKHAIVYGERGVGKTSLVSVIGALLTGVPTVRLNCNGTDTFASLWKRAFDEILLEIVQPAFGFPAQTRKTIQSLAESLGSDIAPDTVTARLRRFPSPVVFIFDEFDRVENESVSQAFADTMKALSDYAVPTTVIIVGIGETVAELVKSHASIERAVAQVPMPRMTRMELGEIVDKVSRELGLTFAADVKSRIVNLAQGLPHYVHLLGLHSTMHALHAEKTTKLKSANLDQGIRKATDEAQQTLLTTYHQAVISPQKDALFKSVLLACSLAPKDVMGYFAPADVRAPLTAVLGRSIEFASFNGHLGKFITSERGKILTRSGVERKYRYRFSNPLMPPYVIMRGVADDTITLEDAMAQLEPG